MQRDREAHQKAGPQVSHLATRASFQENVVMNDDFNFMAESFPGLVAQLQENDLQQFEEQRRIEREKLNEIRAANNQGLNISELTGAVLESARAKQQLEADLDKMQQDAAEAAAKKEADAKQLPEDRFPAPVLTV